MRITLANPDSIFTPKSQAGADQEGAKSMKGMNSMDISAYVTYAKLENFVWIDYIDPLMPHIPLKKLTFDVFLKTFNNIEYIQEFKRLETVSSWTCRHQEVLRHLALAPTFVDSAYWPTTRSSRRLQGRLVGRDSTLVKLRC
jgi:hypothetical protein